MYRFDRGVHALSEVIALDNEDMDTLIWKTRLMVGFE
jgi:hypothetical protein